MSARLLICLAIIFWSSLGFAGLQETAVPGNGAMVTGVVRAENGRVVANAIVVARFEDHNFLAASGQTDATGRYTLTKLQAGKYGIAVTSDDYPEMSISGKVASATKQHEPVGDVHVYLCRKGDEHGARVRRAGGRGRSGVVKKEVRVRDSDFIVGSREVVSDAQGQFRFSTLTAGDYYMKAMKGGRVSAIKEVAVEHGHNIEKVELALSGDGTITGVVLGVDGRPMPQASIRTQEWTDMPSGGYWTNVWHSEARTDASGHFRIPNLPLDKNPFRVVASRQDGGPDCPSDSVELTTEKPTVEVEIRIKAGASISGTIRDTTGRPIGGVAVVVDATSKTLSSRAYTRTDDKGRYKINGLPRGTFNVYVEKNIEGEKNKFAGKKLENLQITEGQSLSGVDFVLSPGLVITGVLVDLNGEKLSDWSVRAFSSSSGEKDARTDSNGKFRIENMSSGTCKLEFDLSRSGGYYRAFGSQNCEVRTGEVAVNDKNQVFVVPIGGTLQCRVLYEGTNTPVTDARVRIRLNTTAWKDPIGPQCAVSEASQDDVPVGSADERFRLTNLPIGSQNLEVHSETAEQKGIADITVERNRPVDLHDIFLRRKESATEQSARKKQFDHGTKASEKLPVPLR